MTYVGVKCLTRHCFVRMGEMVSAFDSSASWVDISRCEIESSYIQRQLFLFRYDIYSGPLSMLSEWRRRLKLIQSITEQLKSKECKAVIAVLIAAKSKVLKNWKVIDAGYDCSL